MAATKRPKRPNETQVQMTQLVMPFHCNQLGSLFGGQLVAWMDMAASTAAMRHAQSAVVTVAIDQLTFKRPILSGHAVILTARVDWVGRTSMEVKVEVLSEDPLTGERAQANEAYLTFVAIDRQHRPTPVPKLLLESEADQAGFRSAERRRERRLREG